ncbi:MAG: ketoacyl-ACP synthase III [Bdellovibrionales bacterium]|nr:ketoacyl-ACP synthase III [Bdellovibrionales bacterium]
MKKKNNGFIYCSKILGTGSYLPEKKLTNVDLERIVDTNDQWIVERTGIRSRRMAAPGEYTSDLALAAAKQALSQAQISAQDLDMIILATVSPDQVMPNTACVLQKKLGARDIMAVDVSAACTGFVYAFSIADQFVRTGVYKNILVVGAEVLHQYVNYKDRETCILFGDAAGAVVLGRADENDASEVMSVHLHADGEISDLFVLPAGGSALPFSQEVLDQELQYVKMKGREIFKHAVRTMANSCEEALQHNNMTAEQISWVVPHQANLRIIEAVAKHCSIPMEKVVVEIEEMGNTSAATVPVALDKAVRDGRIQRGQNIILTAFGAGITSGSVLLTY